MKRKLSRAENLYAAYNHFKSMHYNVKDYDYIYLLNDLFRSIPHQGINRYLTPKEIIRLKKDGFKVYKTKYNGYGISFHTAKIKCGVKNEKS